jgi:hypothetical protein
LDGRHYQDCAVSKPIPNTQEAIRELIEAAQGVVGRWDSPKWKDLPHTADYIHRLREALTAITKLEGE